MRALCYCLLLVCPALQAQNSKDFQKVTCRFLSLERTAPPPSLINTAGKGTQVACTITSQGLSPATICYAQDNRLSFVSRDERKPLAVALVPPNGSAFILVFFRALTVSDEFPWRVLVIEDRAKNLPDGGALVGNLYSQDIRFTIGSEKIQLHPAGSYGVVRPAQRDPFNMASVVIEYLQKDEWRTASESMLRFVPGNRYLIFVCADPASGRPKITTYRDNVSRGKAEE